MIHVAVAVIENDREEVLISKRHDHLHQGGLWEYPGGKIEEGETVRDALAREVDEELGVKVETARPLIRIPHDYGDKQVLLDVWLVSQWSGEVHGKEDQPLQWVPKHCLTQYAFPEANRPITKAIQLPVIYAITPEPVAKGAFIDGVNKLIDKGISLIQLRSRQMTSGQLSLLADEVKALCESADAILMINGNVALAKKLGVGVHLRSRQLHELSCRPLPMGNWVAASCHSESDLERAAELGLDFVVLSPVKHTASHPDVEPMGWDVFHQLCEKSVLPVYALGGMDMSDVQRAQLSGGQGVAGIGGFWSRS